MYTRVYRAHISGHLDPISRCRTFRPHAVIQHFINNKNHIGIIEVI